VTIYNRIEMNECFSRDN